MADRAGRPNPISPTDPKNTAANETGIKATEYLILLNTNVFILRKATFPTTWDVPQQKVAPMVIAIAINSNFTPSQI